MISLFLNIHYTIIIENIKITIMSIKFALLEQKIMDTNELYKNIDKITEYIFQIYSFFTDAYLLRRVLDKNYVNKCIVYYGGAHSINYIFFLVKYCNFHIIKIHNSTEKNISTLTKEIKSKWYSFDIYELFYLKKKFVQCINYEPVDMEDIMIL